MFAAHAWRWAGLDDAPRQWKQAAESLFPCFARGLMTRLLLKANALMPLATLRLLFVDEPVVEVVFDVGRVQASDSVAVRTLLPFPHAIRVTVVRQWSDSPGTQDAFVASLLSSPVMTSATELTLDAVSRSGLPGWLAKSPFLGNVWALGLARNGLTCTRRVN